MTYFPRGIRNHNPGNIKRNRICWRGMCPYQEDPVFVNFEKPIWGLRALMKILLNYQKKYGLKTIRSFIHRWAPPVENLTDHYVWHVCAILDKKPDDNVDLTHPENLKKLAQAIVIHENGHPPNAGSKYWYPENLYNQAINMVLP